MTCILVGLWRSLLANIQVLMSLMHAVKLPMAMVVSLTATLSSAYWCRHVMPCHHLLKFHSVQNIQQRPKHRPLWDAKHRCSDRLQLTTVSNLLHVIGQERMDPFQHVLNQTKAKLQSLQSEIMIDIVERC